MLDLSNAPLMNQTKLLLFFLIFHNLIEFLAIHHGQPLISKIYQNGCDAF